MAQNIPENYSIRISSRARYVRLNISLGQGIVVVVPKNMSQRQIEKVVPQFVREKKQWISRAFEKLWAQNQVIPSLEHCPLPEQVFLNALAQVFTLQYNHVKNVSLSITQDSDSHLIIRGDVSMKKKLFALLEQFFKDYARHSLQQRLDELSRKFSLPYNRLTIRAQKTRWGSCSSRKNINLNYRLLFIDSELVDYILLHELTHTIHMNHSTSFWSTLEKFVPDARLKDKQVNEAGKTLPCWIYHQ